MGKPAQPSKGLPSRRSRRRFRGQRLFRVASVRECIRSERLVLRPCIPPYVPIPTRDTSSCTCCLRSFSSTPTLRRRCYGGTRLPCDDLSSHLPNRVAEANTQNGLIRILEDVHDLARRSFEIETLAIGEQVNVRAAADDFGQAFAKLALKETHDLADSLQGEAFAAQFTDDGHFSEVLHRVETAMPKPFRLDHAALVPPLKLACSHAGQSDHFLR